MKRWGRWLLAILPLVGGIGLAAYWQAQPGPAVIYQVRFDRQAAVQIAGGLISLGLMVGLAIQERAAWREQNQARSADARVSEERRRFFQRLDHEFKNPLTAMRAGMANLISAPAEDREAALASVEIQIMRLSRLSGDLRKLAEMEQQPLESNPVDLSELLEEAVELACEKPEAQSRRVSLHLPQAPWPLPQIVGDRDLIYLAVYNLLDNALKYTRPGDTIEVAAIEADEDVLVEIADTGPGIPEDETPHVWDELYRGKGARSQPGSGVGLALVRAIIERHGGQVQLRSRVDQGTRVILRLPQGKRGS